MISKKNNKWIVFILVVAFFSQALFIGNGIYANDINEDVTKEAITEEETTNGAIITGNSIDTTPEKNDQNPAKQ